MQTPYWEIPTIPDIEGGQFQRGRSAQWDLRAEWHDVMENGSDIFHLPVVHGEPVATDVEVVQDGPARRVSFSQVVQREGLRLARRIEHEDFGPGFGLVRISLIPDESERTIRLLLVSGLLPTTPGWLRLRFTFYIEQQETDRRTKVVERLLFKDLCRQIEEDAEIWKHRRHVADPPYSSDETNLKTFRQWAVQFHGDGS